MFAGKKIAVVMPAHNEASLIERAVRMVPRFVDHVIVVDDASTDETPDALARSLDRPGLICIRHPDNRGVGAAIVSGYRKALEIGSDIACVMAGDAQMDPEDLPRLLSPIVRGEFDYVKGDRLSWPGARKIMPFFRFIGNHALSRLTRIASGYRHLRDSQCGYTAVTAELLSRLDLGLLYERYGFPNDMLAKVHAMGGRLANVAVRPIYEGEVSGISLATALFRVPLVIIRSYLWRLKAERTVRRLNVAPLKPIDG